ncbi:hypothetical protein DTO166G4_5655 [Paecilomyces variotii]|nr:hypothetical protein DTO164E3_5514 [Paecilomyces variotii]KAJ9212708.1 hypothetical protein DTO166G4_5655 [Paecilomyces variotii]KAJ9236013.1 hypothetical protein DTO166G5_4305 [Paecilomyces variotii]KAJ9238988.1 hypothetical protein DTO169E5_4586 [Paecilomyces variotii]KAJ9256767.1 hypothetical protein DTO207G8_2370 [Paecilomyces variotii]
MKFLSLLVPTFAVFSAVSAAPTALSSISKPVEATDPTAVISTLFSTVQEHTAKINSTAAGVSQSSPLEEQQAAGKAITAELAAINSAVVQATSQVQGIHKHAMALKNSTIATRQTVDLDIDLAPLVTNLLLEVSGTLDNVISSLGLPATLSFLGPLVGSLGGLLASLEVVVNQLLALVKQLLDGLLTGLSEGLTGLAL